MSRALFSVPVALLILVLAPAPAGADGLPIPVDGAETASVLAPDGSGFRYATVSAGKDTRLLQIDPNGGEITGSRTIDGKYSVPLVSLDGVASGISGDGTRLVLINPRGAFEFPRSETSFVVVDLVNGAMRPQKPLTFRGDFSFDALSPDGLSMFLIEYTSPRDYNDYVVREYDFANGRLVAKPVLVPDEDPGEMRGLPMTRASSADGRWEYTLYDGGGDGEPFIHALDTVESRSVCIDVPQLESEDAFRTKLALTPGGDTLEVTGKGGTLLATVDTETFAVSDPPAPAEAASPDGDGGFSGLGVGAIAVGLALVAGTALGLRRRRRDRTLPPDPFESGESDAAADINHPRERDRVST